MKVRMIRTVLLALLAAAAVLGSWPAQAQEQIIDMRGTWTGWTTVTAVGQHKHTGHNAPEAKFYDFEITYQIEKQEGRRFVGKKITKKHTEDLIGVVAFDNKSFYAVDSNGKMVGKINSPSEIETYYLEATPAAMIVSANRLRRQP